MATLILTAVGTALGGPIGGALGALAGQAIDATWLRPKGRQGPRLIELAVQTSSYGAPIPRLFGTMRVAGTVIWSTDLIEHATTEGGGKGRGSTTTYSYSASFAVLLSARAVQSVGRIWADGKLLRGGAGDFKTATRFRLYTGGEEQAIDPLIASAEGIDLTPACRGQAYAVFEDMPLAEFGNRIPSLTFEVVADPAPVRCGTIVEAVAGDAVDAGEPGQMVTGYSAYGATVRDIVSGLCEVSGAWFATSGGAMTLRAGDGAAVEVADTGAGGHGRGVRAVAPADTAPRAVTVSHHDPARDFQAGLQRARRAGSGLRELRIDLPMVLEADAAKTMAEAVLRRADIARERRTIAIDWRAIGIAPGDRVTIAGEAGQWRIADWSLEAMVLTLGLARIARAPLPVGATPGRVVGAPDAPVGATMVHAFEIPPPPGQLLSAPRLVVAAAGEGAGWRGAEVQVRLDGGGAWMAAGTARRGATLGRVAEPLAAAPSTLIDRHNVLDVTLANAAMSLADADAAALDRGVNLAVVGEELLQFARAVRTGPTQWRLSGLWRGRRGTEWAAGSGTAGARFCLVDPAAMLTMDLPAAAIGASVSVMASGAGDGDTPAMADALLTGASVAPPSPVHLGTEARDDGSLAVRWTRRSRAGWHWIDGIDAALAEERELYSVGRDGDVGPPLAVTAIPEAELPAGSWEGVTAISVRQAGAHAPSRPGQCNL